MICGMILTGLFYPITVLERITDMTDAQQRAAAKAFAAQWKGKGYEKGESQPFWISLLRDVYGVEHPETFISR